MLICVQISSKTVGWAALKLDGLDCYHCCPLHFSVGALPVWPESSITVAMTSCAGQAAGLREGEKVLGTIGRRQGGGEASLNQMREVGALTMIKKKEMDLLGMLIKILFTQFFQTE